MVFSCLVGVADGCCSDGVGESDVGGLVSDEDAVVGVDGEGLGGLVGGVGVGFHEARVLGVASGDVADVAGEVVAVEGVRDGLGAVVADDGDGFAGLLAVSQEVADAFGECGGLGGLGLAAGEPGIDGGDHLGRGVG